MEILLQGKTAGHKLRLPDLLPEQCGLLGALGLDDRGATLEIAAEGIVRIARWGVRARARRARTGDREERRRAARGGGRG